jgi:hypothetical protein
LFNRPPAGAQNNAGQKQAADDAAEIPAYYLFRYFDYDVEPGKRYAYRVFPLLMNPNGYDDISKDSLLDPRQHDQQLLGFNPGNEQPDANSKFTNWKSAVTWSNLCQTTRLPGDLKVTAGTVEPPKSPSPTEILSQVRFLRWDQNTGANMNTEKSGLYRGTTLNFDEAIWKIPGDPNGAKDAVKSDNILVDIMGGEALTKNDKDKIHGPEAMLTLDESGNLVIHDEMGDAKEWTAETKEPERPDNMRNGGNIRSPESGRMPRRDVRPPPRSGPGLSNTPDPSLPDMAPRH